MVWNTNTSTRIAYFLPYEIALLSDQFFSAKQMPGHPISPFFHIIYHQINEKILNLVLHFENLSTGTFEQGCQSDWYILLIIEVKNVCFFKQHKLSLLSINIFAFFYPRGATWKTYQIPFDKEHSKKKKFRNIPLKYSPKPVLHKVK